MVFPQQRRSLEQGEAVFREGEAADKFCILAAGSLAVHAEAGSPAARADGAPLARISAGECFGESALLRSDGHVHGEGPSRRSKTVTCTAARCEVVEILGRDFLRLVEKSRVVRESFGKLSKHRNKANEQTQARHTKR